MKKQEISKHYKGTSNPVSGPSDNRGTQCEEDCKKRGKRNLVLLSLGFIMLFAAGYFIHPGILRKVWLIASGTLALVCILFIFMIQVRIVTLKC